MWNLRWLKHFIMFITINTHISNDIIRARIQPFDPENLTMSWIKRQKYWQNMDKVSLSGKRFQVDCFYSFYLWPLFWRHTWQCSGLTLGPGIESYFCKDSGEYIGCRKLYRIMGLNPVWLFARHTLSAVLSLRLLDYFYKAGREKAVSWDQTRWCADFWKDFFPNNKYFKCPSLDFTHRSIFMLFLFSIIILCFEVHSSLTFFFENVSLKKGAVLWKKRGCSIP